MSKLQSAADYQRELAELDRLIELTERGSRLAGDPLDEISLRNLHARREALRSEMEFRGDVRMEGHELTVVLSGRPVRGSSVETEFLSKVLSRLQGLVRSILGEASGSRGRQRRRYSEDVKRRSTLRLAGTFSGSFGLVLDTEDEQLELSGSVALSPVLDRLIALMQKGADVDGLLTELAAVGERPARFYRELLSDLESHSTDMTVAWQTVSGTRDATVHAGEARQLLETLEHVRYEVDGKWYTGYLDMGWFRLARFEFIDSDGSIFQGVVEKHVLESMEGFFSGERQCRAYILTQTATHLGTGEVKVHHRLQELRPIDETSG